jgi:hypothetical protein
MKLHSALLELLDEDTDGRTDRQTEAKGYIYTSFCCEHVKKRISNTEKNIKARPTVLWNVTPCIEVKVYGRFRRTFYLHRQRMVAKFTYFEQQQQRTKDTPAKRFFFRMARQPLGGLGLLIFRRFTITHFRHTTLSRTPLDE